MLRNILAVVAGFLLGGLVNGTLIGIGPSIVPPPEGADLTTVEGLRAALPLLEPKHFMVPFVAHALGTLVGSVIAFMIAASHRAQLAGLTGVLFLCGGIAAAFMIPAPGWFIALDLIAAYIPMAWLGIQIGSRLKSGPQGALAR